MKLVPSKKSKEKAPPAEMIPVWALIQRQSLPLESKIRLAELRIRQWYEHWHGQVYVSFSGGKDSTVLLDLVRSIYPNVPAVFCDTGLEFPEIREFVKSVANVVWMKPRMNFKKVIEEHGFPVVSKKVAKFVWDLQRPDGVNDATKNLRLTGFNRKGVFCPTMKLSKKWLKLVDAPFKISHFCCDIMKKEPFKRYIRETGRKSINGTMAADSQQRKGQYLRAGCNMYDANEPQSKPISVWLEADVWQYIHEKNLPYSKIYDMGYARTGCSFCAFGAHMEKEPNRFQLMKKTHPKLWLYCMTKLGMREVLEFVGVPCE